MTTVEPAGANEPLDELDLRLLAGVRELWEDADPMPATLVDQIRFAIQLEDIDLEVMRIREQEGLVAARSAAEQGRLITFDSESLTIMVNVSPEPHGHDPPGRLAHPTGRAPDRGPHQWRPADHDVRPRRPVRGLRCAARNGAGPGPHTRPLEDGEHPGHRVVTRSCRP